jgi:hypothetical protein
VPLLLRRTALLAWLCATLCCDQDQWVFGRLNSTPSRATLYLIQGPHELQPPLSTWRRWRRWLRRCDHLSVLMVRSLILPQVLTITGLVVMMMEGLLIHNRPRPLKLSFRRPAAHRQLPEQAPPPVRHNSSIPQAM